MNSSIIDNVMLSQRGKRLYIIAGFKFRYQKSLADGTERWSCCKEGCRSFVKVNEEEEVIDSFLEHNHSKDSDRVLNRQKLSNLVKIKAIDNPHEQPIKLMRSEMKKADVSLTPYDATLIKNNIHHARAAQMQRKWKSLRDCYTRELAKTKKAKIGTAAENPRKYIYFKELSFLSPVCDGKSVRCDNEVDGTEAREENDVSESQNPSPTENIIRKADDEQLLYHPLPETAPNLTELPNEVGDTDMHFLLSLLPHFKGIPQHLKFEAQFDIMKVIKKYKPPVLATGPSSYYQYQCEPTQFSYSDPVQQNIPSSSHNDASTSYMMPSPLSPKNESMYSPAESFTSETVDCEDVKF